MEEERRSRSTKLKTSIDNLKDCTAQILAQAAALAKASMRVSLLLFIAEYVGPAARAGGRAGRRADGRALVLLPKLKAAFLLALVTPFVGGSFGVALRFGLSFCGHSGLLFMLCHWISC